MAKKYSVTWTQESKKQVDHILSFLRHKWSEKEAENLLDLLLHFERVISQFPKSFKVSSKFKGCRLGLIHQHVTAIYKVSGSEITVLTVLDNRTNIDR